MRILCTLFMLFLFSDVSFAEKHDGACKADVEKFCKDVKPGKGRIAKCLKDHDNELSSDCKEKKEKMKEKVKNFRESCKEDIKTHCGDIKPGKFKIVKCLKEKEAQLSPACKESLQKED